MIGIEETDDGGWELGLARVGDTDGLVVDLWFDYGGMLMICY